MNNENEIDLDECAATECEFYHEGYCIIEDEYPDMKPCPKEKRNNKNLVQACSECEGDGTIIDLETDMEVVCPECGGKGYETP